MAPGPSSFPPLRSQATLNGRTPADDIPAYNSQPASQRNERCRLCSPEASLRGDYFRYPWQVKVYKEAATIQPVLFQLPCYCRCDRAMNHNSLHSCFEGTHGAECSTCAKEEHYAYVMTQRKMTPQQIRAGIERKEFEAIDLQTISSAPGKSPSKTTGE